MPNNMNVTKDELSEALARYDKALHDESIPEREVDQALQKLDALAPHSYISDLLHGAERERTDEEVISEALLRERIWQEGGIAALYSHLEKQLSATLLDPSSNRRRSQYCEKMLMHIRSELGRSKH